VCSYITAEDRFFFMKRVTASILSPVTMALHVPRPQTKEQQTEVEGVGGGCGGCE
jgi:hypothetical protein